MNKYFNIRKKPKFGKPRSTTTCGTCGITHIVDDRVEICDSCGGFKPEHDLCEDCGTIFCRCGIVTIKRATD